VWSIKSGGTLVLDVNTFDNSRTVQFGDLTGLLTIGQQVTLYATQTQRPIAASALGAFAAPIVGYGAGVKITFNGGQPCQRRRRDVVRRGTQYPWIVDVTKLQ
jgi:hypothetical protein